MESSEVDRSFVHPEYFKYLATCLEEETAAHNDLDSDNLSPNAFNQGYFERFFVSEGPLGRGSRGEVLRVRHVLQGVSLGVFALKRIAVGDSQRWLSKLLKEVHLLGFRHTNLVNYNHVWLEQSQLTVFGPTVPVLHILQEYCDGGDLERYVLSKCCVLEPSLEELKDKKRRKSRGEQKRPDIATLATLPVDMIYSFFKDVLFGLQFLHKNGMIHRDLKPSNCLLDISEVGRKYPKVLVSDFGEGQLGPSIDTRTGGTGTLLYTAPEIINNEPWTPSADMFSLGMVLYFLAHSGRMPYQNPEDHYEELREEISRFKGYQPDAQTSFISTDLGILLSKLLSPNPLDRPTCTDLEKLLSQEEWSISPVRPNLFHMTRSSLTFDHTRSLTSSSEPVIVEPIDNTAGDTHDQSPHGVILKSPVALPDPGFDPLQYTTNLTYSKVGRIVLAMVELSILSQICLPYAVKPSVLITLLLVASIQYRYSFLWSVVFFSLIAASYCFSVLKSVVCVA